MFPLKNEEKKVEYLELIYDLVFVYMAGRNNALLGHIEGGFVSLDAFLAYILCTLAIIQIWNFTTFYINMFGRNGVRDHVFLLITMYLMYFLGESTRSDWHMYQAQYHIAWGLILINIGMQYAIELRNHKTDVWNRVDMIVKIKEPLEEEYAFFRPGLVLYTYLHLAADRQQTDALLNGKVKAVAYETIQEADRSLPCLSPMSQIAGRLSIQEGAKYLEK